jgi:chemotaxis protein histidine kinase CheA
MSHSLGTADFFTLEAGECLNRLEALLARPEGVSGEEFVRQVRLLRGAALMANLQPVAQAGAAFEALARGIRDGLRPWDAATREMALQVVDDFRALVRRVGQWSDGDTARARRIATDLERMTGQAATPAPTGTGSAQTGVRAFVAREGALIASALDRASRAMRTSTDSREALHAVLRRMQQLRGLAELSEFAPLPEILDGVELAVGELARSFAPPDSAPEMVDAAAHALSRVCRDVTETGRPTADAPEARRFADLLRRTLADDEDVVAIESLLFDGEPAAQGARSRFALGAVELVSHGEFLSQVADRISGARSGTERDLRLLGLLAPLGALGAGARELTLPVSDWASLARSRIASGHASANAGGFAEQLRRVGALLRGAADAAAPGRDEWTMAVDALRTGTPTDAEPERVVPIAELAPEPEPEPEAPDPEIMALLDQIVPIETLGPDVPATDTFILIKAEAIEAAVAGEDEAVVELLDVVESISVMPPADRPPTMFEASLLSYSELLHEFGVGEASLAELIGATPTAVAAPAPVVAAPPAEETPVAVSIDDLLYRGRAALLRAAEVRLEMRAQLERGQHVAVLRPLLDELLDLVPLALDGH